MSSCFSKTILLSLFPILVLFSSCGIQKEKTKDRSFVSELGTSPNPISPEQISEPIMRNLPNDLLKNYGACRWLKTIKERGGSGRFRIIQNVELPKKEFWEVWKKPIQYEDLFDRNTHNIRFENLNAKTDIGGNNLYQFALAYFTDKSIPNSAEFFKLFDERMFSNIMTFPGFLALRTLLTLGIVNSVDARNKQIQKEVQKIFPGIFKDPKIGTMQASFLNPLIRNGTSQITRLSPWIEGSLSVEKREEKFWRIFQSYSAPLNLFSKSTWAGMIGDFQNSLSVAIDSWNSIDPEEQACANILFQRSQAQLLSIMGHDRPGFWEDSNANSWLFNVPDLLTARDSTKIRVCPTPGSFAKLGRRAFIALDDFAIDPSKRPAPIKITKGPYAAPPCTAPIARDSREYSQFKGEALSSQLVGQGNDLIDFLSATSQYVIAMNPGAPWWRNRKYPLVDLTGLDSLEKSGGILPSVSYALSLGLTYLGLERVLDSHLIFVDSQNRRTSNQDAAFGVRISHQSDNNKNLEIVVSDAKATLRMTELAFKFYESFEHLAFWNEQQLANFDGNTAALEAYKAKIKSLFASESNFKKIIGQDAGGALPQLKRLQLATSLLLTKFAKKLPDGTYTCYTKLQTHLQTGDEIATGDCRKEDKEAHKLFKNISAILAKKYSSPLFADFAR